ncbi:MAG: hypothetical protein WEB87_04215 [Bacteriovoracaceae bacterium]
MTLQDKTAVLVSPLLLRRIGAGQIDYCFMDRGLLHIVEVKSSITGVQAGQKSQKARLFKSARFLSQLTGVSAKILFV